MSKPDLFAPRSGADILHLITSQPLAWLVSGEGEGFRATLLPLRPVCDAQGEVVQLMGHFARSNGHHERLRQDGRAWALFLGPNSYISPSWMHDRSWGPTWNYASVQFRLEIELYDDAEAIAAHLQDLVETMETGRANSWSMEELGPRYAELARHVVGFRATVQEVRAKFKLGQDERPAILADIESGLAAAGYQDLLEWTRRFNSDR